MEVGETGRRGSDFVWLAKWELAKREMAKMGATGERARTGSPSTENYK